MAGKKGQSGRKSWDKELASKELWELSVKILKKALSSPDVKRDKKIDISLHIFGRLCPKEINFGAEAIEKIEVTIRK